MTALARAQQQLDLEKVSAQQLRALHSLFHRFAPSLPGSRPEVAAQPPGRGSFLFHPLLSPDGTGDDATLQRLSSPTLESARKQRLEVFLRSRMSPVRSGTIRTLGEANRVIWALRNMIRRAKRAANMQGGSAVDVGR